MNYKNRYNSVGITKMELLFTPIIIILMISIGFIFSDKITGVAIEQNNMYDKALRIYDQDKFNHCIVTGVGDVFTIFEGSAIDTVTLPELNGEYMYIEKIYEEYTMHTITTVDSNGNTKTSTYWSWDTIDRQELSSKIILINNIPIEFKRVNYCSDDELKLNDNTIKGKFYKINENYVYTSGYHRHCYNVIPIKIQGSMFVLLKDKTIKTPYISLYRNIDPDVLYDNLYISIKIQKIIFWFFWFVFICIIIYGFICFENRWLD